MFLRFRLGHDYLARSLGSPRESLPKSNRRTLQVDQGMYEGVQCSKAIDYPFLMEDASLGG